MGRLALQVVVHNLPWGCTWQNLKDAFAASTQSIERADVIIDSSGRSRCASALMWMSFIAAARGRISQR